MTGAGADVPFLVTPHEIIDQMLDRSQDDCLQTCDPRIVWEDEPPGAGWEYEDFSFGLPENEYDDPSDWSKKP